MLFALAAGAFAFSEIMYDWPGADAGHEWVELVNCSGAIVEIIDEFRFFDGASHLINKPLKGSPSIPPGGVFILAADAKTATSTFFLDHPGFAGTVFDTAMSLNNTNDTPQLRAEAGTVPASVAYQSSWGGQGDGKTIEKGDPCDGNPQTGWHESSVVGGTPGSAYALSLLTATPTPTLLSPSPSSPPLVPMPSLHTTPISTPAASFPSTPAPTPFPSVPPVPSPVLAPSVAIPPSPTPSFLAPLPSPPTRPVFINEILPSPEGPDTQAEFIELLNPNDVPFDISRWYIDDGDRGSAPYQMPQGTSVGPKSALTLSSAVTHLALNNGGDSVRLLDPARSVVESITYGKAEEGSAYARLPDGAWRWTTMPTPGSANVFPQALSPQSTVSKNASPKTSAVTLGTFHVSTSSPVSGASSAEIDLTRTQAKDPLSARIGSLLGSSVSPDASSNARSLVLAASASISLSLILVFVRRFF